jgi:hypothetical protein
MWIWRVQSFQLVKVPEKQFGQFYQGMEILAFFFFFIKKKRKV